jgi:hypothetical protein
MFVDALDRCQGTRVEFLVKEIFFLRVLRLREVYFTIKVELVTHGLVFITLKVTEEP